MKKPIPKLAAASIGIILVILFALKYTGLSEKSHKRKNQITNDSRATSSLRNSGSPPQSGAFLTEDQIIANPILRGNKPNEIIQFLSNHELGESEKRLAYGILKNQLKHFTFTELLDLFDLDSGGEMIAILSKDLAGRLKNRREYQQLLESFLARNYTDRSSKVLFRSIAEEVGTKDHFLNRPEDHSALLDMIAAIDQIAVRSLTSSLWKQLRKKPTEEQISFLERSIAVAKQPEALDSLLTQHTSLMLETGKSHKELEQQLFENVPNSVISASSILLTSAFQQGDHEWVYDFANRSIQRPESDDLSKGIIRTITKLLIEKNNNPRQAMDWSLSIPSETPERSVAIHKSFGALFEEDQSRAKSFMESISEPNLRRALEKQFEGRVQLKDSQEPTE